MEIKNGKFYILGGCERIPLSQRIELSVVNDFGTYSDNQFNMRLYHERGRGLGSYNIESEMVEIALLKGSEFVTKDYIEGAGDVIGFITPQELEKIIKQLKEVI